MKYRKIRIAFSVLVSIMLAASMLFSFAFAEDDPVGWNGKAAKTESEASDRSGTSAGVAADAELKASAAAAAGADTGASAGVEVNAVSGTNNIVGDVFSNMFNTMDDPEMDLLREGSLEDYPLDDHDLSYYGDSLRVRHITDGGIATSNYLVYRDSYLIISEENSKDYETSFSEDGLTAYVTPAVPAGELEGRTGIVFLADDLGDDSILVFDGAPRENNGVLTAPLKKTEELTVNMLFSDGELTVGGQQNKRSLKASGDYDIEWELSPDLSGTNWKASIDHFSPKWPSKPGAKVDVFDLLFELHINLKFSLDYDIVTTGATGKRETRTIAGFTIPLGPFSVTMDYNLQVQFDETPVRVKGKMTTDFDYGLGTHGATIEKYRTEVTVSELTVDPHDPDNTEHYNKDINFYIGSQIDIKGEFLKLTINLGFWKKTFGPVLKIAQESEGGSYVTARHEKDQFEIDPGSDRIRPSDIEGDEIHTCARHGEAGCLCLEIRETYKHKIYLLINLYFKKWEPKLAGNDEEKDVSTTHYHRSYTFGDAKIIEGWCPHIFYRVPVHVWQDEDMRHRAPAGIDLIVRNAPDVSPIEQELISGATDDNGQAALFLPYKDRYVYQLAASGTIDGVHVSGYGRTVYIQKGLNPPVDIILGTDAKTKVRAEVIWDADADENDVPTSDDTLMLLLFRRKAGSNDEWKDVAARFTDKAHHWNVDEWNEDKFGFEDGKAFLYEYRVRIAEWRSGSPGFDVITPEKGNNYITRSVDAYVDAAGEAEQSHYSKYYITNEDSIDENTGEVLTTIKARAVVDIDINKIWQVTDDANKPGSVYLALQQRPQDGWENVADASMVPRDWTTVMRPLSGTCSTLGELEDEDVLTTEDYIGSIDDVPLAIGRANEENGWKLSYTVPKYRNGVLMQHEGTELDKDVIESLLINEYDYTTSASVKPAGNYVSVPGLALNVKDYTRTSDVVNLDPLPPNTIAGTVRWQSYAYWWNTVPDSVRLDIYKDGEKIDDITLNKSDHSEDQDIWIWMKTLDAEDHDPDALYTVEETFPDGSKEWIGVARGLEVYNYHTENSLQVEAQAVFDYAPSQSEFRVQVRDKETRDPAWELRLRKQDGWWSRVSVENKNEVKDVSAYELAAPDIPGYVKTYGKPYAYARPGWGNLFYNFTVYYVKQSDDLKLHIRKEWTDTDASTNYPEEVIVNVYRDGELIAEETIKQDPLTGDWDEVVVSEDSDGNSLKRVDSTGRKYIYTIVEEPVEGFTTSTAVTEDSGGNDITYTLTNRWVGDDYVNVRGTITWDDDEHAQYRPETVSISVINSKEEEVRAITVPVAGNDTYEAKYLPGKDSEGSILRYSVLESHVRGYTTVYDKAEYDEETKTWKCDITNRLTGHFPLRIKKTVKGRLKGEAETYEFKVEDAEGDNTPGRDAPLPINKDDLKITGAGETTAHFMIDEDGVYLYSVSEKKGENSDCRYDDAKRLVMIARSTDEEHNTTFRSWVAESDGSSAIEIIDYAESGTGPDEWDDPSDEEEGSDELDKLISDTVEFINCYPVLKVEKKWDIDLEGKDRPDSIQVLVQKKDGDKWSSVSLVELGKDNDWSSSVIDEGEGEDGGDTVYRVRELREETALQELAGRIKDLVKQGKDKYDEWVGIVKAEGKTYWDALPDDIRNAADEGYDSLIDKLNAKPEELYDKLMEKFAMASAESRIVYDKDDSDKSGEANEVTYHVGKYISVVSGGTEDAHITKYKTDYSKDGDTYTIRNTAMIEIDEYKRWIGLGVDDDDMPDSVWMLLMVKPKDGALDNAKTIAETAGVDISSVLSYEFPLIDPMEGGMDPLEMLGKMSLGVDLGFIGKKISDLFGIDIPKIAVGKTDADSGWKLEFTDKKYKKGIPMEYKGAELTSEIIRQIINHLIQVKVPVSYDPLDNYISIPMKAVKSVEGIEEPSDLLDLSKLSGAALEKAKKLTMDDIRSFGWGTILSDYHLMANVINIKVDWDGEDDPEKRRITVSKVWDDGDDADGIRPDSVRIRLWKEVQKEDGTTEQIHMTDEDGDPAVLILAPGNNWSGSFKGLDRKDENGNEIVYTVSEDDFDDSGSYSAELKGDPDAGFTFINKHTPEYKPPAPPVVRYYTITYKLNGGAYNGRTDDIAERYRSGTVIRIHEAPVREGYRFLYWKGSEYQPGDKYTVTSDHTLEAQWEEDQGDPDPDDPDDPDPDDPDEPDDPDDILYEITYKLNGGLYNDSADDIVERYKAGTVIRIHEAPVREGYRFLYWKGSEYQPGDEYTVTSDHTLEAQWEEDQGDPDPDDPDDPDPDDPDDPDEPDDTLYEITYKLNGGAYNGSADDIVEKYKAGTVIRIHEAPVREGYRFMYWKGSEYQPGDEYTVTSDHTLEAQWEEDRGDPDPDDPDDPDPDDPDDPDPDDPDDPDPHDPDDPDPDDSDDPDDPDDPDEPGTPSGNTPTGDRSRLAFWLIILLTAAGTVTVLLYRKR